MSLRLLALALLLLLGGGPVRSEPPRQAPRAPMSATATPAARPTPLREWDAFADETVVFATASPAAPTPTLEPPLAPRVIWAHIVAGESGGGWPEGSRLVAWTLRAWELHKGMPPAAAGPEWGWYGWREMTDESWAAVNEVWGQPLANAPWDWMRAGNYCYALGSNRDALWWDQIGWYTESDFHLTHPTYPDHGMHCYFGPPGG